MTARKTPKRALGISVLSLVLCIVMLAGTTFAWFTDSVSSENNIIKAGNLDIELYWSRTADDKDWHKVGANTNIFKDDTLWEPGHTEVVYLKVVNEGSLALKYWLGVNIADEIDGVNQQGNLFRLSDHIEFGVVKTGDDTFKSKYDTREEALAAIDADEYKAISAGYSNSSVLYPKTNADALAVEEYATLVVTMPEDVGNEANHNGIHIPKIFLGLNVFATQLTYEEDSYGSDYDIGAPWTGEGDISWYNSTDTAFVLTLPEQLAGLAEIVNSGTDSFNKKMIVLGADIDLNNLEWTPIGTNKNPFNGTFDGDNRTISNLLITGRKDAVGLFGWEKGTIQNLTVENAKVSGDTRVGVIAGQAHYSMNNITVTGHVEVVGYNYVGGVAGQGAYSNWTGVTVDVTDADKSSVKAISTSYDPEHPGADENGFYPDSYWVGGVLGHIAGTKVYMTDISSNIDVYGNCKGIGGAFGIVNYSNVLENVTVTGDVHATADGVECMGGIAGARENKQDVITFNHCNFDGKIVDVNGKNITTNDYVNKLYGGLYRDPSFPGLLFVDGKDEDGNWAIIDAASFVNALAQGGNAKMYTGLQSMHSTVKTSMVVPADKTVTLDLNGYTAQGDWGNAFGAALVNNGTLTVKNGTLKNGRASGYSANGCSVILNNGNLTLQDVTIIGSGWTTNQYAVYPGYAIDNRNNLTVEAGTTINAGNGIYTEGTGAVTEINGGTIDIKDWNCNVTASVHAHAIYAGANSTVIINGGNFSIGTFTNKSEKKYPSCSGLLCEADGATLTINGGTFTDPNGQHTVVGTDAVISTNDELVAAIKAANDGDTFYLAAGSYALRFTNDTTFNVDNLTFIGLGEVNLSVSSSEVSYDRIQGDNVTFENINFTGAKVGATGKATYNYCTFADRLECASSNSAETYANNCTMDDVHTDGDMAAGNAYFTNCTMKLAEYAKPGNNATMTFTNCTIGTLKPWNMNTTLNDCTVTKMNLSGVTDAAIVINGSRYVTNMVQAQAALDSATPGVVIQLAAGKYGTLTVKNFWGGNYTQTGVTPITIRGGEGVVVGAIDLNGMNFVNIENITFDAAKAVQVYAGGASTGYGNIVDSANTESQSRGVNHITITNCVFTGTTARTIERGVYEYCPINFMGSNPSSWTYNIEISDCDFLTNAWNYVRINNGTSHGFIKIMNNTFGGANYTTGHHAINASSNASDLTITGNEFINWNPAKTAFASSRHTGDTSEIVITITGNTFSNTLIDGVLGTDLDGVIELKSSYTTAETTATISGNTYVGGLAGYTDKTAPMVLNNFAYLQQ